jgi:methionyl-tRNA formyltransferase
MKIVLLSTNICSAPALQFLAQSETVQAVVAPADINPFNQQLERVTGSLNIPFKRFPKNELATGFKQMLGLLQPDVVLVFAFPYKIPAGLFGIPKFGFYNVHFSLLPRYRGRCPVFWQLKNGDESGGISIHQVTEQFDDGPLLMQREIPVAPGSNHGIHWGRLSLESVQVIASAIEKLKNTGNAMLLPQNENPASTAPAPKPNDLAINWETQSAKEIEDLVNAANPDYGGAVTMLRQQVIRLLEVVPAEFNNPVAQPPGTIVYADGSYGLFVACKNQQYLRINIVHSTEGILSGFKLAALGVQAGERLLSIIEQ